MHNFEIALCLGVAAPMVMFAVLVFFGHRIGKPASGWVAVFGVAVSLALSVYVLVAWRATAPEEQLRLSQGVAEWTWTSLSIGGFDVPISFKVKLDSLTVAMYFMVTLVSTCIFVFSVGYMAGHSDEIDGISKYHRFFAYLSLFEFSMLGLVIASSLFFLFVFWELVGLCSYLLIGYYFDRKYASDAGIKAFVTNRVGDFGFIAGLMLVFVFLQTLDLDQAAVTFEMAARKAGEAPAAELSQFATAWLNGHPEQQSIVEASAEKATFLFTSPFTLFGVGLATLMGICLFCGAIGKSAQFPLHVWLPDAMAGPTPVSALIHAATMVAAGVYLVARIFRLLTPEAQLFIALIGCITLAITALIAIVQTDIKKVLAYSTLSQLGYMIFGMGVGAWVAALFHLITHAFFKAMLFLGSGQVIEGCHHEQDIRKMGGLHRKMPVTCWTFFIGVLAIAGFGIPGAHLGLGGYFSKDEILAVAYERSFNWDQRATDDHAQVQGRHAQAALRSGTVVLAAEGEHGAAEGGHSGGAGGSAKSAIASSMRVLPRWMFWLPIIIAYVTPFYMMRCWWLTFMGKPRDEHVYEHAHEMSLMWAPLVVLAAGTVLSGYVLFRSEIATAGINATDAALVAAVDGEHGTENMLSLTHGADKDPHQALAWYVGFAWLVGMGLAAAIYARGLAVAERIRSMPVVNLIHVCLVQKLFFDHIYNGLLVGGTKWVLAQVSRLFDTYIIDGLANFLGRLTVRTADFSGLIVDAGGVDGFFDGLADSAGSVGKAVRRPQTGRIRNYVLFGTAGASLVLLAFVLLALGR